MSTWRRSVGVLLALLSLGGLFSLTGCKMVTKDGTLRDSTQIRELEAMQRRGSAFRNTSDFERAIAIHDSCIEMAISLEDTIQWVIALNNQATNYRRLDALKEASDLHFLALELCDKYSDTVSVPAKKNRVRSLNGLGNVFMALGNYEAAKHELRMSLEGEIALGSATGQAINLANLGTIMKYEGKLDSARIYYQQSLEKNIEDDNTTGICLCHTYLGELDEKMGHIEEAESNFRSALAVGQSTGDIFHWLTPCISLASNLLTIHKTDSADKYINIGVAAAQNIGSSKHLADLYALRSRLEEMQGQTALALRDLQQSYAYRDSMLSQEQKHDIQNSRVNYIVKRSSAEVKAATDQVRVNRLIRNVTIIFSFIIIVSLLIWFFVVRRAQILYRRTMTEREQFYRNVTHQLRTPLTVVLGMLDQLSNHVAANDAEGLSELDAAKRQGHHLLGLVKALIKGSREGFENDMNTPVSEKPTPASQPLREDDTVGGSILLAEDNEDVAILICTLLREHGYQVKHANDGREALDMLADELPDLLITDIAMPRMDGLELMRNIREDETMNHLPIMVVSARVEDSERIEGIQAGAEVYLAKPFINEELLLRVRKLLNQRALLRHHFSANAPVAAPTEAFYQPEEDFLETLNKLIEEHMREGELNANLLAHKMLISVSTLNRKLTNLTGLSSSIYIRNRRLLAVKHLLATTEMSISEIEAACGFNTVGYMGRLFRTEVGCSPSEYRKQIKG